MHVRLLYANKVQFSSVQFSTRKCLQVCQISSSQTI